MIPLGFHLPATGTTQQIALSRGEEVMTRARFQPTTPCAPHLATWPPGSPAPALSMGIPTPECHS
jgi:hypothetical protein